LNVIGLTNGVKSIAAGRVHSCAILTTGEVKCWGQNVYGQLGDGTNISHSTPISVTGLSNNIIAISAGRQHTCVLTSLGEVLCWGRNYKGQLGNGTTINSNVPVKVDFLNKTILSISAGYDHTCAVSSDGEAFCWGANGSGRLGDGTTTQRLLPTDVLGLTSGVKSISSGLDHTCAIVVGEGLKCWGNNAEGQLGDGTTTTRLTPTDVTGLTESIINISSGPYHTCAVNKSGGALCWGRNRAGQIGDGTTINRWQPVGVNGLPNGIVAISTGEDFSCAVGLDSGAKCWGDNSFGKLGNGTLDAHLTPIDVLALEQVASSSNANLDGFIWESTETSGIGFKADTTANYLRVGDDNSNRQYRAFLSFNTASLPDTAVIHSSAMYLRYSVELGGSQGSPDQLGPFIVDIRKPFFGASNLLLPEDFQAASSMTAVIDHGSFSIYGIWLKNDSFPLINLTGQTQFRLRYQKNDNDNMSADYTALDSGNAIVRFRPQLYIYYYVP
jgi:alpha-tubulin suppressor-like RCC1 family protein